MLRSDFYVLTEDVHVVPADGREPGSLVVDLDPDHYKLLARLRRALPGRPAVAGPARAGSSCGAT